MPGGGSGAGWSGNGSSSDYAGGGSGAFIFQGGLGYGTVDIVNAPPGTVGNNNGGFGGGGGGYSGGGGGAENLIDDYGIGGASLGAFDFRQRD